MSAAELRIAQLERADAEDEVLIQRHAQKEELFMVLAEVERKARKKRREQQQIRGVIIDQLRAEGLPAMQPIQRMLPRPQHAEAGQEASEETGSAERHAYSESRRSA